MPRSRLRHKANPPVYAIIGTGLIGASLGLALRRAYPRARIIGFDIRPKNAAAARRRRALTAIGSDIASAVAGADIIILAAPFESVIALLPEVFAAARSGSLVLDVAGLKSAVLASASRELKRGRGAGFAGGHPLAGSEHAGPLRAHAGLFDRKVFALCIPAQRGRVAVARRAKAFVRAIGARPTLISAREHDRVVAVTSALPQIVSSALAWAAAAAAGKRKNLSGPGLRSATRLAASPPQLWARNLIENRSNVLPALDVFEARLRDLRRAIKRGDRRRVDLALRRSAAGQRRLSRP